MQKLVNSLATDATALLSEEAVHTDAYEESIAGVESALQILTEEFKSGFVDQDILRQAIDRSSARGETKVRRHEEAVCDTL